MMRDVYCRQAGGTPGNQIPDDPELPLPLNQVHPIHEVVHVDYFLPGCPPSGDAIWTFMTDLLAGRTPALGHGLIHYD
jgi:NAD-reducing hydrogenase small subunit